MLYADEPDLVGRTFALSPRQRQVLATPKTQAEISNLAEAENVFERGDRLLEVYRPVWTPSGTEVLFEMYAPYSSVGQRAGQLTRGFAGVTLSSLLLLVVLVAPILWHLTQRLRRAQGQRELLLERALDASAAERRRVAASLHDGPVQELAATSFTVAGAAARADATGSRRWPTTCTPRRPASARASGRCGRCSSTSTHRAWPAPVCPRRSTTSPRACAVRSCGYSVGRAATT